MLAFAGITTAAQGNQGAAGVAIQTIAGTASTAQGTQVLGGAGTTMLAFVSTAVTGQGSQSASGTASQLLAGVGGTAQGGQSSQVASALTFAAGVATAHGGQSISGTDVDVAIAGTGASGQGSQETSGVADAQVSVAYMGAGRTRARWRPPPQIGGHGESAQGGAQTHGKGTLEIAGWSETGQGPGEASGFARVLVPIVGTGACTQGLAPLQGYADVHNRIPRNRRKAHIAAALLLAA